MLARLLAMNRQFSFARWAQFLLAFGGIAGVAPIITRRLTDVQACPSVGMVPACYVVGIGYVLVGISAFMFGRARPLLFGVGWAPLLALALAGTTLELLNEGTCPATSIGIPACFISLGIVGLLLVVYAVERRASPAESPP